MANEFKIKNALQILNTQPVTGISNDPSKFNDEDASSVIATISSIKSYFDTLPSGDVTKVYVDSSLQTRDSSITRIDASLNDIIEIGPLLDDKLDVSGGTLTGIVSYNEDLSDSFSLYSLVDKAYVDNHSGGDASGGITWSTPVDATIEPSIGSTYNLGTSTNSFDTTFTDYLVLNSEQIINGEPATGELLADFSFIGTFIGTHIKYSDFESQGLSHAPNVGIGYRAGAALTPNWPIEIGSYNTITGFWSGEKINTGSFNTLYGSQAGRYITTGDKNVAIGESAGDSIITSDNNIAIGYKAGGYDNDVGNKLYIHNNKADTQNSLIYGEFDNKKLNLNANIEIKNSPNSYETNFGIDAFFINCIYSQSDDKILISGWLETFNEQTNIPHVIRINTDGSLDETFNTGFYSYSQIVKTINEQSDGKILVGNVNFFRRLLSDGTEDSTFYNDAVIGVDASSYINHHEPGVKATLIQPDGKIIVAGKFNSWDGVPVGSICRLDIDGTLDATWHTGIGFDGVHSITKIEYFQGDIMICGDFDEWDGASCPPIITFSSNTGARTSFNYTGTFNSIGDFAVNNNDEVLVISDTIDNNQIELLQSTGTVNPSFNTGSGFLNNSLIDYQAGPRRVLVADNINFIIGGNFYEYNNDDINNVIKIDPTGTNLPFIDVNYPITSYNLLSLETMIYNNSGYIMYGGHLGVTFNVGGLQKTAYVPVNLDNDMSGGVELTVISPSGKILTNYSSYFEDSKLYTRDIASNNITVIDYQYMGSPDTNGSWRFYVEETSFDLVFQQLVSGTWTEKHRISS